MDDLPPLESLRAFEAAARHEGFVQAGQELGVTAATISHRVQALERHMGADLFSRHGRGVRLNTRGREYAQEIRRIFKELRAATERHRVRSEAPRLRLVAVEVVAEKVADAAGRWSACGDAPRRSLGKGLWKGLPATLLAGPHPARE